MGKILPRLYLRVGIVIALAIIAVIAIHPRRMQQADGSWRWETNIPLGLDLKGGAELLYRIRTENLSDEEKKGITEKTIAVIHQRVDPQGRMELDIRPRGQYRFYIQLPGMTGEDAHRIEELIRKAGKLLFCMVDSDPAHWTDARGGKTISGFTPFLPDLDPKTGKIMRDVSGRIARWHKASYRDVAKLPPDFLDKDPHGSWQWFLVNNRPEVTGEYLVNPSPTQDQNGLPAVGFGFRGKGKADFENLTSNNTGKQLAIILDEALYSAPTIQSRISGSGIITGAFTRREVEDLVTTLRAGQLPADIELEWNNAVGAQLGEDSIKAGVEASLVGLAVVVIFMAVYYLVGGAVADFAVLVNLLLVLGGMVAMHSVLTLPGIAGLVLTLGMAVDANVLINERIREESQRGKTLRLAIRTGYERAFLVILDTHLTTIITALILFGVGTGPVRGFAITLILGLVLSLFTSYWVTRWLVDILIEKGWLNKLHMLHLFGRPNIPFSRYRYLCIAGTVVFGIAGLTVFLLRWDNERDTELSGGFRAEMELKRPLAIGEFRKRAAELFPGGGSDVQTVWSPSEVNHEGGTAKVFSIRIQDLTLTQKQDKMREDIVGILKAKDPPLNGSLEMPDPVKQPWDFKLQLDRPLSVTSLRDSLAKAHYSESEIREVTLQGKDEMGKDKTASEFIVKLKPAALVKEKDPDAAIAQVLDALTDPPVVSQTVHVEISDVLAEPTPTREGVAAPPRPYVLIKLREACSTAAVREAICRQILDVNHERQFRPDLRVTGHGTDSGSDPAREMAAWGAQGDLDRIAGSKKTELRVMSFSVATGELHVSLAAPESQLEFRSRLNDKGVLDKLVRSTIPVGVEGKEFLVSMASLSEEKTVEKIKEELLRAFGTELTAPTKEEEVTVNISLTEPPAELVSVEQAGGARFYKLELNRDVQLQQIHATLMSAGYGDALAAFEQRTGAGNKPVIKPVTSAEINTGEVGRQSTRQVFLRLSGSPEQMDAARASIVDALQRRLKDPFRSIETIGSAVAGETRNKAVLAILMSWVAMIFYLWFRFGESKFGLATVIALVHDVCFTLGAVGVADALSGTAVGNFLGFSDIKVNLTMIAAFLTLMGYSANDTIVVFDRIRENMGGVRRRVDETLVDTSVNQTLSRTVLTSLTVLFVVVVLYIMGGPVIHGFAFVMTVGVIVGTYSSIFIASPILIGWEPAIQNLRKLGRIVTFRS